RRFAAHLDLRARRDLLPRLGVLQDAAYALKIVGHFQVDEAERSAERVGPCTVNGPRHLNDLALVLGLGRRGILLEVGTPLSGGHDEIRLAQAGGTGALSR